MDKIKNFHSYVLDKLRVNLINNFYDQDQDPERCQVQENLLDSNWKECGKAIDDYNTSIHFYERIDMVKKEMDRLDNDADANPIARRTPRFFDNQEKSINSLKIDNKRAFVQYLTELDQDYERMVESLMADLKTKKEKFCLNDNHYEN